MMDGRDIGTCVLPECGCEDFPDGKCEDESSSVDIKNWTEKGDFM